MRVAHVLGYLAARYGGPPQVALQLGRVHQALGLDVSWWAAATPEEQRELAHLGSGARLFAPRFPRSWYRAPALRRALAGEIGSLDILHLHQVWDYPLLAAGRLARRAGKPYLIAPHGIFNERWRYATGKKALYLRVLFRPILDGAACIQALTDAEAEACRAAGIRSPITVVPNGVDPEEFRDLPAPTVADEAWPALGGRPVALFLGRLSPEKGLDQLVPAWRRVAAALPEAMLVLAGPDFQGHRAQVEAMVRDAGLGERVLLPGMVGGRDRLALLSRADAFVLASHSEALSMAVLEALACATPCVITTGCHFPAVAEAGAGEVVPPDSEAIAAALLRLLSLSPEERRAMGERGRQIVLGRYTWEKVARQMLTVYRCMAVGQPIPLHPEPAT